MNSNTIDRRSSHRRRGTSARHAGRTGRARSAFRPAARPDHARALLPTPAACDTSPVGFASLGLDLRLLEGLRDLGYQETRPIQSAVIPLALAGRDIIGCAETGTGKTAAFAVPILQRLLLSDPGGFAPADPPSTIASGRKSRVLILAPTRELAVQIEDEIHGLSYHTPVTSAAIYGGVEMSAQERALKAGVDIIVATPGRLMDHMRQQNADLSGIDLLVLDEADRMMDMGFWPDVRRILTAMPSPRQTLLFSATLTDEVIRQAPEIVHDAAYVQVGQRSAPAPTITHRAAVVPSAHKFSWLVDHLRRAEGPVLVFTRMKVGAERLARRLADAGIRCTALHADRTQDQRRAAIEGFRGGRFRVLVATDIAARGLDIDGIHTVINFELPDSHEAYVHRVGRTGRSDLSGRAITLVDPDERHTLAHLEKSIGIRLE